MSRVFNRRHTALSWYELGWPQDLDAKHVTSWLQALSGNHASTGLRFITIATRQDTRHYIVVAAKHAQTILHLISTFLPDVEATKSEAVSLSATLSGKLRMTTKNRVLEIKQPEVVSHAVLSAVRNVQKDERIVIEWLLGSRQSPQAIPNKIEGFQSSSWVGMLAEAVLHAPRQLDAQSRNSMRSKHEVASWKAAMYVGVQAATRERCSHLYNQVSGAIRSAEAPGVRLGLALAKPDCLKTSYSPLFWPLRVNVDELTGLLHWPLGKQAISGVQRITSKRLAVQSAPPYKGRIIAESNIPGSRRMLALGPQDALMHTHVLGPTGVGKSTLLLNLITQDIADNRGVVVIDPKGDLVNDILERIPAKRRDEVVILDPSDASRPVGLNPLARHGQPSSLVVDDILAVFRGLYGSYFGPRTQDILHAGLLTLTSIPGMSLCTLPILYTNPAFRYRLVNGLHDPLGLGGFWSWFDTISDAERNNVLAPVMNKLRAFLMRPAMRRVIGQGEPLFKIEEVFTKRRILLVNLAKGNLGSEAAQLFGSLVVSQVWQAVQSRSNVPQNKRAPAFVYVDEVQDYLHLPTDIGDVLAQSRSYGVGMALAHQHLGQLPTDLKTGVLSNARSRICFQLSHDDANVIAKSSKILEPHDFENLSRYHIYARLVAAGEVAPWASGKTLAPQRAVSDPAIIRALSRERYGRDAVDVEVELGGQIAGFVPDIAKTPIGRKARHKIGGAP
ncbi:MAG TPA: type IV secretion system DNA-binding domain-containing protein [Patescibacteria group bacterium]|nr:type IV secretion system DNA-binding domain-containing protein [Patescibacteria group bacterium]